MYFKYVILPQVNMFLLHKAHTVHVQSFEKEYLLCS